MMSIAILARALSDDGTREPNDAQDCADQGE